MKYIKENKRLLTKYLLIILFNVIIHFLCNFYLKNISYKDVLMVIILVISDLIIYYYKGTTCFKYSLDILEGIITGLILIPFIKSDLDYSIALFPILLANNIVFMRSRYSEKFLIRSLQYLGILVITILCMIINIIIFLCLR